MLLLTVTAVSASEVNSTDTVSTTDNFEVSVCENNTGEVAVAALPNTNSENVNNNGINVEGLKETSNIDDELNVSAENSTSNFELRQFNNVKDSVQDKRDLLGAANNLIDSNDDTNTILHDSLINNGDSILSATSNELLSASTTFTITYNQNIQLELKVEATGGNNYKATITRTTGSWYNLYIYFNNGANVMTLASSQMCVGDFCTFSLVTTQKVYFVSYLMNSMDCDSNSDYLPVAEVDTTVSVTNPSVKYNSGEFSVSGTETGKIIC